VHGVDIVFVREPQPHEQQAAEQRTGRADAPREQRVAAAASPATSDSDGAPSPSLTRAHMRTAAAATPIC
jgi:hypothetical protein